MGVALDEPEPVRREGDVLGPRAAVGRPRDLRELRVGQTQGRRRGGQRRDRGSLAVQRYLAPFAQRKRPFRRELETGHVVAAFLDRLLDVTRSYVEEHDLDFVAKRAAAASSECQTIRCERGVVELVQFERCHPPSSLRIVYRHAHRLRAARARSRERFAVRRPREGIVEKSSDVDLDTELSGIDEVDLDLALPCVGARRQQLAVG
mmetsp:Transcript_5612/g.16570  ORF Transcript_5612/g.16570 Transcript_5612/m.16570 type:complete len:206 (+) Transcript_5612:1109-1726(+)